MNERQEQTADVLGKLTVLGTIVLPLNIICGMWGMNVKVPGQDVDSLTWFWSSKLFPLKVPTLKSDANEWCLPSYGGPCTLCLCFLPYCETGLQNCIDCRVVPGWFRLEDYYTPNFLCVFPFWLVLWVLLLLPLALRGYDLSFTMYTCCLCSVCTIGCLLL